MTTSADVNARVQRALDELSATREAKVWRAGILRAQLDVAADENEIASVRRQLAALEQQGAS